MDLVSTWEDVFMAAKQTGVFERPNPLLGDYSKRNQKKFCWFHRDINHTTKECITLKDEIEKLIHRGYLQEYVNDSRERLQNDWSEADPPRQIRTIFNGLHFAGETRGAWDPYFRETWDRPLTNVNNLDKRPAKHFKREMMMSPSKIMMHTSSITPTVMPWSLLQWWPTTKCTGS